MTIRIRHVTAALATVFVASCGGGGGDTAPDTTVASVTVTGASTIAPGSTSQMTATAKNAGGTALPGLATTWSSTATNVATVNSTGLVSAIAAGSATIKATIAGVDGQRSISVQTVTVVSNATVNVAGTAFTPNQVDLSSGGTVTWSFQDPFAHNVTFDSQAGAPANIGDQSSGTSARVFTQPGTYSYHCTIHAGMSGTIVVH